MNDPVTTHSAHIPRRPGVTVTTATSSARSPSMCHPGSIARILRVWDNFG